MKLSPKILLRVSIFGVLTLSVLLFLNSFFQPVWTKWNNFYTTKGFYEEPKNTIETVFLGASVTQSSVSPIQLYDEHGICSYNLGTEQQPVLGSYYWLRETYDYHSETLKTVVLDVSALRSASKESFYHKCFDNMRLSKNKLQGVYEYVNGSITRTISFITPLITYHSRWSTLEDNDFKKFFWDADTGTRGYYYIKNTYINALGYDEVIVKSPVLDTKAQPEKPLREDSLEYLDRMVKFCEEKGLKLVLMKTTATNWDSGLHNAAQEVADSYGLEFYDFNFEPLFDLDGYIHAFDNSSDGHHLNYYGATKFTKWMGNFLVEKCGATDVRNDPKYDFMKEQQEEYNIRVLQHVDLNSSNSFTDYLEHAVKGNTTVLISVQENGANALKEDERNFLRGLGLEKFAEINTNDEYVAVIENGKVVYEKLRADGTSDKTLVYKGTLPDGKEYRLESGLKKEEEVGNIFIDSTNESKLGKGTNIVVYSNDLKETLHSINFNTSSSTTKNRYGINDAFLLLDEEAMKKEYEPTSIQGRILTYKAQVENLREFDTLRLKEGDNSMFSFFKKYWKDDVSVMIALQDCADTTFTEKDRENFRKYGLEELASLKAGDSYVAYIKDGEVVKEVRTDSSYAEHREIGIYLKSGSNKVGKTSSININNIERSNKTRGLNVVFFDNKTETVISSITFDTHLNPITY